MPMKSPPHPGDFVRTEIIAPASLTVTAAAAARREANLLAPDVWIEIVQ
jgi:plasmid maintenance system antidote protein VapI